MDESETVDFRITHKNWKRGGEKMFVIVPIGAITIESLANGTTAEMEKAQRMICNKFRRAAARKYYDGPWPPDRDFTIDDLDFGESQESSTLKRSSQQRGKR